MSRYPRWTPETFSKHTGLRGVEMENILDALRAKEIDPQIVDWYTIGQSVKDVSPTIRYDITWDYLREMYGVYPPMTPWRAEQLRKRYEEQEITSNARAMREWAREQESYEGVMDAICLGERPVPPMMESRIGYEKEKRELFIDEFCFGYDREKSEDLAKRGEWKPVLKMHKDHLGLMEETIPWEYSCMLMKAGDRYHLERCDETNHAEWMDDPDVSMFAYHRGECIEPTKECRPIKLSDEERRLCREKEICTVGGEDGIAVFDNEGKLLEKYGFEEKF